MSPRPFREKAEQLVGLIVGTAAMDDDADAIEAVLTETDEGGFLRGYAQALEDMGAANGLVDALQNREALKLPVQQERK